MDSKNKLRYAIGRAMHQLTAASLWAIAAFIMSTIPNSSPAGIALGLSITAACVGALHAIGCMWWIYQAVKVSGEE
jgi:predicted PurR-regulated permease PerM